MLGLGTSINTGSVKAGESYPSKVLFERSGNWTSDDTSLTTYRANLSVGTTEVAGISNYLVMEMTYSGASDESVTDPKLRIRESDLSGGLSDYFDNNVGGDYKITAKALWPSSNSGTIGNSSVQPVIGGVGSGQAFGTADTWVTRSNTEATEDNDISNDTFPFQVFFLDSDVGEILDGDKMYLTDLKIEFIAD